MVEQKLDLKKNNFDHYFCVKIWKGGTQVRLNVLGISYTSKGFPNSNSSNIAGRVYSRANFGRPGDGGIPMGTGFPRPS